MASRKVTFTLPEDLAGRLAKQVAARDRSRYVADAIAAKLAEREKRLIRTCEIVNEDAELREIEKERRRMVVVVPLSSSSKVAPPFTVGVKCSGRPVVAVLDQLRAVAKERLTRRIEDMPRQQLEAVESGLREILELF